MPSFCTMQARLHSKNDSNSVLKIYTLHASRHAGEYLVWNRAQHVGQDVHRQVVAEDFHPVSFLTVDVGDVYHAHIHADIADVRSFLPVDQAIASTASQVPVQPVGIADRQRGNA